MRLYLREARRLERERRAAAVLDRNAAVWGDAQRLVDALRGE